ncbi:MAG: hypothetical protein GY816_15845, partial [Cytophagales bacterium]|nr:hypothetical protein [Cytophagales bacterium]
LHPSTGGAGYDPHSDLGKYLFDLFLDPKQLKGRKDLYKKVYHESAHRWIYIKLVGTKVKIPGMVDEGVSGVYGWVKGNLRYYLGWK